MTAKSVGILSFVILPFKPRHRVAHLLGRAVKSC